MYEQHVLNALKNIDEVKKFFTSYSSAHLLINSTRPNIFGLNDTIERLEKIRGNSVTFGGIRMLDRPPTGEKNEKYLYLDVKLDEAKRYMLEEGNKKIFEFALKLLYSSFESFIVKCYVNVNSSNENRILYFTENTFRDLGISIDRSLLHNLLKIKLVRNCYEHNEGKWNERAAKKLSEILTGNKDSNFCLKLNNSSGETTVTNVGETIKISYNQVSNLLWTIDIFEKTYEEIKNTTIL